MTTNRSITRGARFRWALLTLIAFATPAIAEEANDRGAHSFVSYVENDFALVALDGGEVDGQINTPILPGDRIQTNRGRIESILADGSILRLDRKTSVGFDSIAFTAGEESEATVLQLERGAISLQIAVEPEQDIRIESDGVTATILEKGLYRFEVDKNGSMVAHVRDGELRIRNRDDRERLRAGDWAVIGRRGRIEVTDERWDPDRFDRWIDERLGLDDRESESARYLDSRLGWAARSFDDYGSWSWHDTYDSWVWRPRVRSDWRPYSDGRWYQTRAGLCWIPRDPWGWASHHYGYWFYDPFTESWVWFPGFRYAPAHVYWYRTGDYWGWCPTGYYNHWWGNRWGWTKRGAFHLEIEARIGPHDLDGNGWVFARHDGLVSANVRTALVSHDRLVRDVGTNALGVVTSAPIRLGDGKPLHGEALLEAVKSAPIGGGVVSSRVDSGLKGFFLRDAKLGDQALKSVETRGRVVTNEGLGSSSMGGKLQRGDGTGPGSVLRDHRLPPDNPSSGGGGVKPGDLGGGRVEVRSDEARKLRDYRVPPENPDVNTDTRVRVQPSDDRPRKSDGSATESRRLGSGLSSERPRPVESGDDRSTRSDSSDSQRGVGTGSMSRDERRRLVEESGTVRVTPRESPSPTLHSAPTIRESPMRSVREAPAPSVRQSPSSGGTTSRPTSMEPKKSGSTSTSRSTGSQGTKSEPVAVSPPNKLD